MVKFKLDTAYWESGESGLKWPAPLHADGQRPGTPKLMTYCTQCFFFRGVVKTLKDAWEDYTVPT